MTRFSDSSLGEAKLVIDEHSRSAFLVLPEWARLVETVEQCGSFSITDPGQGVIVITAAHTNHDPRGGYLVARLRPLRLRQ
jgi:hypothetical protein